MNNREKFLKENVGFHFEDLSLARQVELEAIINDMRLDMEWVYLALSKVSLAEWEQWGFNLFKKPEFSAGVSKQLAQFNQVNDDRFKKENQKKKAGKKLYIDAATFNEIWRSIKAQGRIYTEDEAEQLRLESYYTYSKMVKPDARFVIDMMAAEPSLEEDKWLDFALSVQKVRVVYI